MVGEAQGQGTSVPHLMYGDTLLNLSQVDRIIFCVFQKVDYKFYCEYFHHFYPVEKPPPQPHEKKGSYWGTYGSKYIQISSTSPQKLQRSQRERYLGHH